MVQSDDKPNKHIHNVKCYKMLRTLVIVGMDANTATRLQAHMRAPTPNTHIA